MKEQELHFGTDAYLLPDLDKLIHTKIIATDFDGVLAVNKYPDIGPPIEENIAALKAEQAAGAKVILWTCRAGKELQDAIVFCYDRQIYLDAVNANIPEVIGLFGVDSRKVCATEYWDDHAIVKNEAVANEKEDDTKLSFCWVPVTERLPLKPAYDWVLVKTELLPEGFQGVPHVAELRNGVWYCDCCEGPMEETLALKVVAWFDMELIKDRPEVAE